MEESDSLREDGVIVIERRGNDPLIEDRVSQDVDQEDLFLGNGEAKEVERDLVGKSVQNRGHSEMEGACFMEHLISFTSQSSPCCYRTASACPSS